ncbi:MULTISPECIES: hypothetical protein [unclassified Xenorhabdus]|uniref:hypothetical protein n=1 Tax=Xenorhabdus TaxID=626 RepID=UPI0025583870|nr:hypothetical protein [Xenorhabdus sp. SF857]WFQ80270.1 hypothetical protein PXH59_03635 [Xenorhabdus sp. SF857]
MKANKASFTMSQHEADVAIRTIKYINRFDDYVEELRKENKSDSDFLKAHIINVLDAEGIYLKKEDVTVNIHD